MGAKGERYLTMERSRFSAAMMRSVEVGIQRSADGHALPHLDPAAGAAVAVASAAAAAVDIPSAAILVVVVTVTAAAAARRMRSSNPPPSSACHSRRLFFSAEFLVALPAAESSQPRASFYGKKKGKKKARGSEPASRAEPRRGYVMACVCVRARARDGWGASNATTRRPRRLLTSQLT